MRLNKHEIGEKIDLWTQLAFAMAVLSVALSLSALIISAAVRGCP